jgi:GH15 family glucan-1,4-alpha-glucosidase
VNYGIIGNCRYSALISSTASIDWLCWPTFEDSSVFGRLLDPQAGHFSIDCVSKSKVASHQSYIVNTNVLRTFFESSEGSFEVIDFAPRFRNQDRVHCPTQLIRIIKPLEGLPRAQVSCQPSYDYGLIKPSEHLGSHHISYQGFPSGLRLTTNAPLSYIQEGRPFTISEATYFILSWGQPFEADLISTSEDFLRRTIEYWHTWVKHCRLPNQFQEAVIRSALTLKLHQFEDTGAVTAATTTSIPESPGSGRTWDYRYCWLRDAYFSLAALEYLGHFEELEKFVLYVQNIVSNHDKGPIQPVYSIRGRSELVEVELTHLKGYKGNLPIRIGNAAYTHLQNDIYGELILALSPLFLDLRFKKINALEIDAQKELLLKLLSEIESRMDEPDAGLWELRGKEQVHTFTIFMHAIGARRCLRIARRTGDDELETRASALAARAEDILESRLWNPEVGAYTQAEGSKNLDASLLSLINFGYLKPNNPRAQSHFAAIEKTLLSPDGFMFRYINEDDFGLPESTFSICTFWYIEALARMGRKKEARKAFSDMLMHANHLGLLSEGVMPNTREMWGNFPQTYSHVGLINAAFSIDEVESDFD